MGQNDRLDRWQARTQVPMIVLSLLFLAVLLTPLAATLSPRESESVDVANVVLWGLFAADYAVCVYLAEQRRRYVREHVLDLFVVAVPFLRPLRLVRVAIILVSAARRAGGLAVRRVTAYIISAAALIMLTCAAVVYDAEKSSPTANIKSFGDGLWWAATTVTTVGYGDKFPTTSAGRLTAGVLMVTGIALVGTVTAAVAAWFVGMVNAGTTEALEPVLEGEQMLSVRLDALLNEVQALHGLMKPTPRLGADG